MSNIVSLGEYRKAEPSAVVVRPPAISESFAFMVLDWAEANGVDIENDIGFKIRLQDFMAHLQISAKKAQQA